MEINIVCVGSLKEKYFKDACQEYQKRISQFSKINIIEVKEADYKTTSAGDIENAKKLEAQEIIKHLKGYVISMCVEGEIITSPQLAKKIKDVTVQGHSSVTFVIGGSYGLLQEVENLSKAKISFGKITFPHQLFRVVLLEQIYRAFTIINNKTYHK